MGKATTNNNLRIHNVTSLILLFFFLAACQDSVPSEPLEPAFKVHGRDNGNKGDASDIEVNYNQFGLDLIKNYRAFVVKAENEASHNLDYLLALDASMYIDLAPNEVIPSKGVQLPASMKDSDGDEIVTAVAYRVAVLSLPYDPDTYIPGLAYSDSDIILGDNNIIVRFSDSYEEGSGDLAVNASGDMIMASYDVLSDLNSEFEAYSKVLIIDEDGETTSDDVIFPFLGGVDSNDDGDFYVSSTSDSRMLIYSQGELIQELNYENEDLREPTGVFINQQGSAFVADRLSGHIFRLDDGALTFIADVGEDVLGLTGDEDGNLYASLNNEEGKIISVSPEGQVRTLAQVPTFVPKDYRLPFISWLGHLEYHQGSLYVAGTSTNRLYRISLDGEVSVFGGTGDRLIPYGDILTAKFNRPLGLAFSADGKKLFVSGCEDTVPQHTQASWPSRVYEIELVE